MHSTCACRQVFTVACCIQSQVHNLRTQCCLSGLAGWQLGMAYSLLLTRSQMPPCGTIVTPAGRNGIQGSGTVGRPMRAAGMRSLSAEAGQPGHALHAPSPAASLVCRSRGPLCRCGSSCSSKRRSRRARHSTPSSCANLQRAGRQGGECMVLCKPTTGRKLEERERECKGWSPRTEAPHRLLPCYDARPREGKAQLAPQPPCPPPPPQPTRARTHVYTLSPHAHAHTRAQPRPHL